MKSPSAGDDGVGRNKDIREVEMSSWSPQHYVDIFQDMVQKSNLHDAQKSEINNFVSTIVSTQGPIASEPVLDFLNRKNEEGFASHCARMDARWEDFFKQSIKVIPEATECHLVKPSGPLGAKLIVQWHYPTNGTSKQKFGMTFDDTNTCINMQKTKIGESPLVATFDSYPYHMDKPPAGSTSKLPWEANKYDRWQKFKP